jgi:CheY-like chemotaxis protein
LLRSAGYTIVIAPDGRAALEIVFESFIKAVFLDCHQLDSASGNLLAVLRLARPNIPTIMDVGILQLACAYLRDADACIQEGEPATLLPILQSVLCSSRFGLCRSVAA